MNNNFLSSTSYGMSNIILKPVGEQGVLLFRSVDRMGHPYPNPKQQLIGRFKMQGSKAFLLWV